MRIEALKINAETLPDYLSKTTAQAVKEHNADVDLLCQDARELEGRRDRSGKNSLPLAGL